MFRKNTPAEILVEKLTSYAFQKFLVLICLSVLIVLSVNRLIIPQSELTIETAMTALQSAFNERISIIHNLWLTTGKPRVLFMPDWVNAYSEPDFSNEFGINPKNISFNMSLLGWPMSVNGSVGLNECEKLWVVLLGKNNRLFIDEVKFTHNIDEGYCIFSSSVSKFQYKYNNGIVVKLQSK